MLCMKKRLRAVTLKRFALLYFLFHQSMLIAIDVKVTGAAALKSCFCIALRVELHELQSVGSDVCRKRDIMRFCHFVVHGKKVLVLYLFHGESVLTVRFFRFQRRQCDSAAANDSVSGCMKDISAERADIEP